MELSGYRRSSTGWYSTGQVAKITGYSSVWVARMAREGLIPDAVRVGDSLTSQWRINQAGLDLLIERSGYRPDRDVPTCTCRK